MESCVADLMKDPKMRSKYPKAKERKSHAIAICHKSIMGKIDSIKHLSISEKGKAVKNMKKIKIEKVEKLEKADQKVEKEAKKVEKVVKTEKTEKVVKVEKKVEKKAKKVLKAKAPVVDNVSDKGEPTDQGPVDEIKVKPIKVKAVKKADRYAERFEKLFESVESLNKNVSKLADLVKASAEEAPKVEAPKKAEVKKIVKVEKAEEAKKEEVHKAKKAISTSSGEASEKLLKVIDDLKGRIKKLEESPAPAKVIVSKTFAGDDEDKQDLQKVEKRLAELTKIRDEKPLEYTEKLESEAYDLVKLKKALVI